MQDYKKSLSAGVIAIIIVATILVSGGMGGLFGYALGSINSDKVLLGNTTAPKATASTSGPRSTAPVIGGDNYSNANSNGSVEDIALVVSPSVVSVYTQVKTEEGVLQDYAEGSGVVISKEGHIITNNHVIEKADKVSVKFTDGTELVAEIVGSDERSDLAVLKVKKDNLKPINFADSDDIRVGELAVAIGNSMGEEGTVTSGVISATKRYVYNESSYFEMIQTDAAINPGNSGGALVNKDCKLIGINTMKLTNTVDEYGNSISIDGMGYAIPANKVYSIAIQLIEKGKVTRAGLNISGKYVKEGEVDAKTNTPAGIYVSTVTQNGAAEKAGIKGGMIITKLNEHKIVGMGEFTAAIQAMEIGKVIELEVVDTKNANAVKTVKVTLASFE